MLSTNYVVAGIIIMGAITWSLRALPFFFIELVKDNEVVGYLGKVLPASVMVILVYYTLHSVHFSRFPFGLPELVAITFIILIHCYKRNVFLSIFLGTAVYAVLSHYMVVLH